MTRRSLILDLAHATAATACRVLMPLLAAVCWLRNHRIERFERRLNGDSDD